MPGNKHGRELGVCSLDLPQGFDAVHAWHHHVYQRQVEVLAFYLLDGLRTIMSDSHAIPLLLQDVRERFAQVGIVINY